MYELKEVIYLDSNGHRYDPRKGLKSGRQLGPGDTISDDQAREYGLLESKKALESPHNRAEKPKSNRGRPRKP